MITFLRLHPALFRMQTVKILAKIQTCLQSRKLRVKKLDNMKKVATIAIQLESKLHHFKNLLNKHFQCQLLHQKKIERQEQVCYRAFQSCININHFIDQQNNENRSEDRGVSESKIILNHCERYLFSYRFRIYQA